MIIIDQKQIASHSTPTLVQGQFTVNQRLFELWFRCSRPILSVNLTDTFLLSALLPAMRFSEPLVIKGKMSERLLLNIYKIQDIYHCFDRTLNKINIEVDEIEPYYPYLASKDKKVGCTFSGGVDSFYTVLNNLKEIDHLLFIHGFDIGLKNLVLRQKTSYVLNQAAKQLDKPLIEVETNLRQILGNFASWGNIAHGIALASVATLLTNQWNKFYIPASYTYDFLFPWGSHPVLDPLFSTNALTFEHEGANTERMDKTAYIGNHPVVLESLRVCWHNFEASVYNCGLCDKCVFTMLTLRLLNTLQYCQTFNQPFSLIRTLNLLEYGGFDLKAIKGIIDKNLEIGERVNGDAEILASLRLLHIKLENN